jgi:CO/xanthine dehydrogenase FAD-binding subunit
MAAVAPPTLDDVVAELAAHPDSQLLAGGTDFMVEVNHGVRRPTRVVSLHRVAELTEWHRDGDSVVIGAGVTYAQLVRPELATLVPSLAQAARTVGSPQIRNAGTIGGNLATASPAGDTLPPLAALDATVDLVGPTGRRTVTLDELVVGPKRTSRAPDEVIVSVRVPVLRGAQEYLKVGTRNAMVISVAGVAVVIDVEGRTVRCALGSVGPVPIRARDAEAYLAGRVDWDAITLLDRGDAATFGDLVAEVAAPIDDHRSTAAYRRHAIGVCARRALLRCLP